MGIFINRADRQKFMQEFLNDLIAQGVLSVESRKKKIANGKAGCYLSSIHGLPPYSSIGVSDTNSFLRFWEYEDVVTRKKKIQARKLFLEENAVNIKKILGNSNIYCTSYNHAPIRGYDVEEYNDKWNGFCVFLGERESKETLKADLQKMSEVLKLFMENENMSIGKKKIVSNNKKSKENAPLANYEKNTILYGPPGTGKTFNTMAYAVAICEGASVEDIKNEMRESYYSVKKRYDALKDEGRIEFVTFHQSYGYEDFIEGIKPILGDDDNPGLNYELHPGIFKNFCESAEKSFTNSLPDSDKDDAFDKSWNLLLKKLSESEDEKISIELKNKKSFSVGFNETRTGLYAGGRRYFNKKQLRNIYNGQHGVPSGARDSYRRRIVEYMIKYCGLVKNTKKKEVNNNANQNYVFIIDEINRGNISKIFGELITLIEPSKRLGEKESMKVTLLCSGDEFGVPNNVYILGTMNTADRSIAMMDTALRRRFNFVEMMSDTSESSPLNGKKIEGIDICKMLMTINKRIEYLYDREHTIGHAFFIGVNDFAGLSSVFRNKVIPLLQEYFYDDYEKIRLVLRDNGKSEEHQFVTKKKPEPNLFGGLVFEDGSDDEKYIYEVNEKAFNLQKSYEGII